MTLYRETRRFIDRNQWFIEAAFAFFLVNAANYLFFPEDIGFVRAPLHPYWIVILLIASKYGFAAGTVTGLVSMLLMIFYRHGTVPDRLQIEEMAESGALFIPVSFLSVGIVLGGIREKQIRKDIAAEETIALREKEKVRLEEICDASEKARKILETKIVGQSTTMKTLYEEIRKLEALDRRDVMKGCLELLSSHFQVRRASIYLKEGNDYVLRMAYGWDSAEAVEGKVPCEGSIFDLVVRERKTLTAQDMIRRKDAGRYEADHGKFVAMVPLMYGEEAAEGVVNIEKIDFLAFNRTNLELIELVVHWTAKAMGTIEYLEILRKGNLYDSADGVFTSFYFEDMLQKEMERSRMSGSALTLSFLKIDKYGFFNPEEQQILKKTLLANLKRHFSGIDSVFNYRYGGTYALISPIKKMKDVRAAMEKVENEMKRLETRFTWSAVEWNAQMNDAHAMMGPALKQCGLG
jgi:GGDEF domain-containing protein